MSDFEELMAQCGMMPDGNCAFAGSEFCDWSCPVPFFDDDDEEDTEWDCGQLGHELELLDEGETEDLCFCIHCDKQIRVPRESDDISELDDSENPFLKR